MKILLVSDIESKYIWDYFDKDRFKDIELIISSGDLKPEYLEFLVTLIKAPLLYVHGNHDVIYSKNPPGGCDSIDGEVYTNSKINILGLGGSYKYNSDVHQYSEFQMKLRILKLKPHIWLNKKLDIIVSHAPIYKLGDGDDLCHRGFKCFRNLIDKYNPKYFIHGHQHLNYSNKKRILEYKNTKIINAYNYYILDY